MTDQAPAGEKNPPPEYGAPPPQDQGYNPVPPSNQPHASYPPPMDGNNPPPGYGPPPPQNPGYYPAPQPNQPPVGYAPQAMGHTIVIAQPGVMYFGDSPVSMTCPSCHAAIMTSRNYRVATMAWLICLVLFFFGFWLCSFIPFCVPSCKDVIHHCPNCQVEVGRMKRM